MPDQSPRQYNPAPLDTSEVRLPPDVTGIVDRLSQNLHEVWARKRMDDGWTYGPVRNDERRQHPSLVPYDELDESERSYDMAMVLQTLKPLVALGFTIGRQTDAEEPLSFAAIDQLATAAANQIRHSVEGARSVLALLDIWNDHDAELWSAHPELVSAIAQRLLRMGQVLLAYEAITVGLRGSPRDRRLRQLQALALARSGAPARAIEILAELRRGSNQTPTELEETVGILGGVYKTNGVRARSPAEAVLWFRRAHCAYHAAFRLSHGYYSGVNAATTALLAGSLSIAKVLAEDVREICLGELRAKGESSADYYVLATLGEVELIRGDASQAARWYTRAMDAAGERFADVVSTKRNAGLVASALGTGAEMVDEVLRLPRVAAFLSGADQVAPLVADSSAEQSLAAELSDQLDRLDVRFGFSSASSGGALLFLDAMAGRGGTHIVLPFPRNESALTPAGDHGDEWTTRGERVLGNADEVIVASENRFGDPEILAAYAERLVVGLARLQSEELGAKLVIITDAERFAQHGSDESDALASALEKQSIHVVQLGGTGAHAALGHSIENSRVADRASDNDTRVRCIIFADVVHSSSLTDEQQPQFVEYFMGAIANLVRSSVNAPIAKNTWGDGLYFVFDDVHGAGKFALELRDLVRSTDWNARGLPADLSLRIGLHAGPIAAYVDPITGARNYTGRHTIRAARIEPVTAPGTVYASREFAALAALDCAGAFHYEPVGRVNLAKKSGSVPLFALEWA
jgi:class 3 adenylate cyclase